MVFCVHGSDDALVCRAFVDFRTAYFGINVGVDSCICNTCGIFLAKRSRNVKLFSSIAEKRLSII